MSELFTYTFQHLYAWRKSEAIEDMTQQIIPFCWADRSSAAIRAACQAPKQFLLEQIKTDHFLVLLNRVDLNVTMQGLIYGQAQIMPGAHFVPSFTVLQDMFLRELPETQRQRCRQVCLDIALHDVALKQRYVPGLAQSDQVRLSYRGETKFTICNHYKDGRYKPVFK